jgi:hypothetical protein
MRTTEVKTLARERESLMPALPGGLQLVDEALTLVQVPEVGRARWRGGKANATALAANAGVVYVSLVGTVALFRQSSLCSHHNCAGANSCRHR